MANKIVVGNLKMNMTIDQLSSYLSVIDENVDSKKVVICPTSLYVPYFLKKNYYVGLQNIFFQDEGAYTGEISAKQATSMGIRHVILGHSERRIYFDEIDADINKKIHAAIKYNMKVILCVGETLEEKNMLRTNRVLKRQLVNDLRGIEEDMLSNIIIAYEPVWAIGTNEIPSNKTIKDTVDYIKMIVENSFNIRDIPVLYGGSVNEKNIEEIIKINNIKGVLVGGASTNADSFLKIIEVVVNQ